MEHNISKERAQEKVVRRLQEADAAGRWLVAVCYVTSEGARETHYTSCNFPIDDLQPFGVDLVDYLQKEEERIKNIRESKAKPAPLPAVTFDDDGNIVSQEEQNEE